MDYSFEVQSQNLALVTLKERCHFLKQQLKAVDDENIKLKVQIAQKNIPEVTPTFEKSAVAEIEKLRKEKEQLINQVHILATENSNMWSRLSRLTVVNRNLTRRFTKISDKLEKYGISSLSESDSDNSINLHSKDYRKDLEEMSLKLINSIKLEKTELERQYAQMVELHKNDAAVSGMDLAFSSIEIDEDSILGGVRKHSMKLNQLKHHLLQQQALLLSAVGMLKKFKEREKLSPEVKRSNEEILEVGEPAAEEEPKEKMVIAEPISTTVEAHGGLEQICPMCGGHITGQADEFSDHVMSHFDDFEEPSLNSFVHIP